MGGAVERHEVHFDFNKSDILESDKPILVAIAAFMKGYPRPNVFIDGNCDERGTFEYHLALGEHRAHELPGGPRRPCRPPGHPFLRPGEAGLHGTHRGLLGAEPPRITGTTTAAPLVAAGLTWVPPPSDGQDVHEATSGLAQPPTSAVMDSASAGPQVPGW